MKVKRESGKIVKNKHRKHQSRLSLQVHLTTWELIPLRWKYNKRDTPQKTPLDKFSYAISWLCLTLRLEKVRMGLRQ